MCQYLIQDDQRLVELACQPKKTYIFIKVLDPRVGDNPVFSMSGLPKESESHLLADNSYESRGAGQPRTGRRNGDDKPRPPSAPTT